MSQALAISGALLFAATLAGGQLLFKADTTYQTTVALKEPVRLDEPTQSPEQTASHPDAVLHQANRIPTDVATTDSAVAPAGLVTDSDSSKGVTNAALNENDNSASSTATADSQNLPTTDDSKSAEATTANEPPRPQRMVKFLNGSVTLDIYQHPHIGNPEAPHVMLEFASYDCSHCREMHRVLHKALRRYGDQFAIVVLPYPQEMECNKEVKQSRYSITGACATARMAVGVATLSPKKFAQFHDWLMEGKDRPPTPSQSIQKAYTLVGADHIREMRPQFEKKMQDYLALYARIKATTPDPSKVGLPLMVLGDHIMSGSQESDEKMFQSLEQHLGVKPPDGDPASASPAESLDTPEA
jgi:hypothetical protein